MSLLEKLDHIDQDLRRQVNDVSSIDQIIELKESFFGKKGRISQVMQGIREATNEEKPLVGQKVNEIKQKYLGSFDKKIKALEEEQLNQQLAKESVDITLPGDRMDIGAMHPIKRAEAELVQICESLGFSVASGPIIEDMFHNFEALNIPESHPSRDMHDTFYLEKDRVMRTHTSSVQIQYMRIVPIKLQDISMLLD